MAGVVALGVVVGVVLALALSGAFSPAPPPPLPNPNGYDDFIKAAKMISDESWKYADFDAEGLRMLVATNAAGLKLARTGLGRECRARLVYSATNGEFLTDLAGMKRLAQAFAAEGELAGLEERPGDAAESYVTAMRLGYAVRRGGPIIYALVGIAVEALGASEMEPLVPRLNAAQCRECAAALEAADAREEPAEMMLQSERDWARRSYGVMGQLQRLIMFRALKQNEDRAIGRLKAQQTRMRLLMIQLAARAYELEKGDRPKALADLVPAYLKALPQDPVTGTNMTYGP